MAPRHLLFRQQRPHLHVVYKSKPLVLPGQETASQKSNSVFIKFLPSTYFSKRKIRYMLQFRWSRAPKPKTGSEADCRKPKYIIPHSTAQRQSPEQRAGLCAVYLCGRFPFRAMTRCAHILKNEGADEDGRRKHFRKQNNMEVE